MNVKQIYSFVNTAVQETLGSETVVEEDLGNIVDVGTAVFNANAVDNYLKSLINQIGKVIFVNRPYTSTAPKIYRDSFEFGSIVEKIHAELPTATENPSWQLVDGQSYDPNVFTKPIVHAKFWNDKTTFEIPNSITERQIKESFQNAGQLGSFIGMLYNEVDKAMAISLDGLVMRVINNLVAETIYDSYATGGVAWNAGTSTKAVNLLYEYNTIHNKTLTVTNCFGDKDFLRYACYRIKQTKDRLAHISTMFNIGGCHRFTDDEHLVSVFHSDFVASVNSYMRADVYNESFIPSIETQTVPFWQGSGTDYSFDSTSKIDVVTSADHDVTYTGVLGVLFDIDACGISNTDNRVTNYYNPRAEFVNSWYKADVSFFNDFNENAVVFYVASAE